MWNLEKSPFIRWKGYLDTKLEVQFQTFCTNSCHKRGLSKEFLEETGLIYPDFSSIKDSVIIITYPEDVEEVSYDFKDQFLKVNNDLMNITAEFINQLKIEKLVIEGNFRLYILELERQVDDLIAHPKIKFEFLKQLFLNYKDAINVFKSEPEAINSFNIIPIGKLSKVDCLKKLYKGMVEPIRIIDCDKIDFINAFTNKRVDNGIKWLIKGRNGKTNQASIYFFLNELVNKELLLLFLSSNDGVCDANLKIKYVFRKSNGSALFNLRKAKYNYSQRPIGKTQNDSEIQIRKALSSL